VKARLCSALPQWGWAMLAVACAPSASLELPPLAANEAGTLLLLHVPDRDNLKTIEGVVLSTEGGSVPDRADALPYDMLVTFRQPPAALGWHTGAVVRHDATAGVRLVQPTGAYARVADGWIADPAPFLRKLRVDPADDAGCAAPEVCYVGDPGANDGLFCGPFTWCDGELAVCGTDARGTLAGCRLLGPACSSARWAPTPAGTVRWVADDAIEGQGDGTEANPWHLTTAAANAGSGDVLLLSRGRHVAPRVAVRDLRLLGACAGQTFVESNDLSITGAVDAEALQLVAGFTLASGARLNMVRATLDIVADSAVPASAVVALSDVKVVNTRGAHRMIVGGEVDLTDVEYRAAAMHLEGPTASARMDRLTLAGPLVRARGGATITITDSWLELYDGQRENVADVQGGSLTVRRSRLRGGLAALAIEAGDLTLDRVWSTGHVRTVTATASQIQANDIYSSADAMLFSLGERGRAQITRVAAERSSYVVVTGDTDSIDLSDVHSIDGVGLTHVRTRQLIVRRARVERASVALRVGSPPELDSTSTATMTDIMVEDGRAFGLVLRGEGRERDGWPHLDVLLRRVEVRDVRGSGIFSRQGSIGLTAEDLRVEGVRVLSSTAAISDADCALTAVPCQGKGLWLFSGANPNTAARFDRFRIAGVALDGLDVAQVREVFARHGHIEAPRIGLIYRGAADWQDRFSEVQIEANIPVDAMH